MDFKLCFLLCLIYAVEATMAFLFEGAAVSVF